MIKIQRIIKGTTATLLAALAFVMIVWAHSRSTPPPRGGADSTKAVKLRLTFAGGAWANVTEFEGGTIKIEKDGKRLAISPYIREQGQVELRLFKVVQREGKETMDAAGTLLIGKEVTKVEGGDLVTGVQVLDANKTLPSDQVAASAATDCCVRTCDGILVCGFCVCTDCARCGPRWCDCAQP